MNNPLRFIDPDGRDVWEKVKNFFTGKGWRDDNLQENYQQKDWGNMTPQLAEEQGITKDVKVYYEPVDILRETGTPGHYSALEKDDKTKAIVMTKGGYEQFDEGNLNNMRSSMTHEIQHTKSSAKRYRKNNKKEQGKWEVETIQAQRKNKSWNSTSKSYKAKVQRYEDYMRRQSNGLE